MSMISLFNGIPNFVGYLMLKSSLWENNSGTIEPIKSSGGIYVRLVGWLVGWWTGWLHCFSASFNAELNFKQYISV